MTVKILGDDTTITGETSVDIVNQMAALQWPSADGGIVISEYMKGVAKRARQQHQHSIRWCCQDHFLEDLIRTEMVVIET